MLKALHIARRMLIWSPIGLGLALALVLLRLDSGPIALDWLKPRIERALTPDDRAVAVSAERIELRLNREQRTLELVGVDVRYRIAEADDARAASFLAFPEVELALSVEALLKQGRIAASEITASAPSLIITRNEDGIIGLYSEEDFDDGGGDVDFGGLLREFVVEPKPDSRLAFLNKLQIHGGRVVFYDRTRASALSATGADLVLTRRDDGVDAWLRASVEQPSARPLSLQLSAELEPGADRLPFELDIADLMPADLDELWPLAMPALPADLRGVRLPVRASVKGALGTDGRFSPLRFDVEGGRGVVDLPAHFTRPLEIGGIVLAGRLDGAAETVAFDEIVMVGESFRLEGDGEIAWPPTKPALALDLRSYDLSVQDLLTFWPKRFGAKTKAWVEKNVQSGTVRTATVALDLRPEDFGPGPRRQEAVSGRFSFDDLSVRYVGEMPPLEQASGRATFDADRLTFDVDGGSNDGLTLNGGRVTIDGMGQPGRNSTRLHVIARAEGTVERALAVLDHPPVEIADKLDILPSAVGGDVTATIDVRMPLYPGVTDEEAVIQAEAELSDLAIDRLPRFGAAVGLQAGGFDLVVDEDTVRLDGNAEVGGVPLAIEIVEPRAEDDAQKRRIGLRGTLDRARLEGLGLTIEGLDGEAEVAATVTETGSHFWVDLEADLAGLAITPPGLRWRKRSGSEGMLHASIAVPLDGPIDVKGFDMRASGLELSGSASLAPGNDGLANLTFDVFRLGETDAAFRMTPDGDGGYEVAIEGERLDLDALFGDDGTIDERFRRFRVALRTAWLRRHGIELADVEADAAHDDDGWRSASVIGTLPAGGKLMLELTPDGDDRRLELRSDKAGALIEALDLGQRVDGGSLSLSARIAAQDPVSAQGRLEIEGFTLRDAPLLARMLTLASLTGIGNLLEGDGIQVDHLIMPFALADRRLTVTDGLMRGSQLGLTMKGDVDLAARSLDLAGTIIPVYSLNRLIGQVPIIGRILTGVDGRGAFAATYSLKGPKDDPTVYVNPLSILTPGLLRDLVGGLINGTLDPPEVRETDD